jgi:hypothetical protein
MLDMHDRRVGQYAVTEVEDMRPIGKGRADPVATALSSVSPPAIKRERIEIALNGQALGQGAFGPDRIDRLVDADRIDSRLAGIGGQLAAGALRKADDRYSRVPRTKLARSAMSARLPSVRTARAKGCPTSCRTIGPPRRRRRSGRQIVDRAIATMRSIIAPHRLRIAIGEPPGRRLLLLPWPAIM